MLIWSKLCLINQWSFGMSWPVQEKQQTWDWPVLAGLVVQGLTHNFFLIFPLNHPKPKKGNKLLCSCEKFTM